MPSGQAWDNAVIAVPSGENLVTSSSEINNAQNDNSIRVMVEFLEFLPVNHGSRFILVVEGEMSNGKWYPLCEMGQGINSVDGYPNRLLELSPRSVDNQGVDYVSAVSPGFRMSRADGVCPSRMRFSIYKEDRQGAVEATSIRVTASYETFNS